jgi:hypothetical protein
MNSLLQLAEFIDSQEDWWRFPTDGSVLGFMGDDPRWFIVGDQPSTSPWGPSHPSRRAFYGGLAALGAGGAHLTDLYKRRGRSGELSGRIPADFQQHLDMFMREVALIRPEKLIAIGQLAHDLLSAHLPELRPKLHQMWHFSYARRVPREAYRKNMERALGIDVYASRSTAAMPRLVRRPPAT